MTPARRVKLDPVSSRFTGPLATFASALVHELASLGCKLDVGDRADAVGGVAVAVTAG